MAATSRGRAGAGAGDPTEIPALGWKQITLRAWKQAGKDDVGLLSAGVAFYAFLAFVPLLAAMVLTYGLVAEPASVVRHVQGLTRLMPSDAANLVGEQLRSVVRSAESEKGIGLLFALLLALYGATRGATSIMTALNIVNQVTEKRAFFRRMLAALAITIGGVAALLLAIVGISMLALVEQWLPSSSPALTLAVRIGFWLIAAAMVSLMTAALYRYGPNRVRPKWRWLTAGSAAATPLWIAATLGFGLYVANFGRYNATYGSLGAVIVFLLWLYLSSYILLMGAEINRETERQAEAMG